MIEKKILLKEQETARDRFKSTAPIIFSIPRLYEDIIVERDKNKFVKVQRIQKEFENLKSQLLIYAQTHEAQYQKTKESIGKSYELLNRFYNKRNNSFN